MTCPHAPSGCNYPEGDCCGDCLKPTNRCGFCGFNIAAGEAQCETPQQAGGCDAFQAMEALKDHALRYLLAQP